MPRLGSRSQRSRSQSASPLCRRDRVLASSRTTGSSSPCDRSRWRPPWCDEVSTGPLRSGVITGTGTSFITELTVNQVVSVPGTAAEIFVVKVITNNTHFAAWQHAANTATGQTATRKSAYVAIPSGAGGKLRVGWEMARHEQRQRLPPWRHAAQRDRLHWPHPARSQSPTATETPDQNMSLDTLLADGDYISLWCEQTSGGNRDYTELIFSGHRLA